MSNIKEKGFTLIEMLVTISIMLILVTVVLANFGGTQGRRNVTLAKNNLSSNLRRMQSYSLASKDINGVASSAYGVSFGSIGSATSSTSYTLVGYNNVSTTQQVLETVPLPTNTYIKQVLILTPINSSTSTTTWKGLFANPYARLMQTYTGTNFSAINEENDIVFIILSTTDNSYSSTLTINGYTGVITEQ